MVVERIFSVESVAQESERGRYGFKTDAGEEIARVVSRMLSYPLLIGLMK